eukprot:GHVU01192336.1.p1 GENE.GHVU01192336.1~~GHVU01192336.1.p1  ORF type:complete len:156 (+),score=6.13 GHVU01192336.1:192-659(+)
MYVCDECRLHTHRYSLLILLTVALLTPLLYYLPSATLAAVVLYGVYGMIDVKVGRWVGMMMMTRPKGKDVLLRSRTHSPAHSLGAHSLPPSLPHLLTYSPRPPLRLTHRLTSSSHSLEFSLISTVRRRIPLNWASRTHGLRPPVGDCARVGPAIQ